MKPEYVVAIGGSAGFLVPLVKIFRSMPKDNTCYVVIRHIAPDATSHLKEILQRHSTLEINLIEDHCDLEANKVYILPPAWYAKLADGKFVLLKRRGYPNCAIDVFLNSLAREYRERAIAIILSGAGANGSEGVAAVKEFGGLTIAQHPDTCEFANMPKNVIATGCVDKILFPEEIADAVKRYERQVVNKI